MRITTGRGSTVRRLVVAVVAVAMPTSAAVAVPNERAGWEPYPWRLLPAAPISPDGGLASAWTGSRMLLFGTRGHAALAAGYRPGADVWQRLPPAGPAGAFPPYHSVWTGRELLVWGQGLKKALDPRTNRWHDLPNSPLLRVHEGFGLVVWTGKEMIGWGGGCCGDAFSDGVAYRPSTNRWSALPRSPLAGAQRPLGAWTGRELVVLVGGRDPDGKPWPARLARAAAYNPSTRTWRRIAPIPEPREGANVVWDGHEVLVVGGAEAPRGGEPGRLASVGFAYDPATNRWRRLAPMGPGRIGAVAAWTGKQLLLWGGQVGRLGGPTTKIAARGLAYDPARDRWTQLPAAPIRGRLDATSVWTGTELLVWGGDASTCVKNVCTTRHYRDGAAFRPS